MDWMLFLTNLNHLSLLLLLIFMLTVLVLILRLLIYVLRHKSCPKLDHFDPERFRDLDSISIISDHYKWCQRAQDSKIKSKITEDKDPDNDSLFTVTTSSDVYQDLGLDVDLNEKFYLKSVRPESK